MTTIDATPAATSTDGDIDRRRERGRRRVTVELAVLVAALAAATALRWIDTVRPSLLPAVQALVPYGAPVATAIIGACAALTRRWRTTAAAAVVVAVHLALLAPWWIAGDRAVPGDADLGVAAANLHYGDADVSVLAAAVDDLDVLVLVEATAGALARLDDLGVTDDLPHQAGATQAGADGSLILSRYPLDAVPGPQGLAFEAPAARISAPGGEVVVLAAHPVPPIGRLAEIWRAELAAVQRWAATAPDDVPLIVAGDLNASDAHPGFRALGRAGLADAHREHGGGPVATWPSGVPWLPQMFHLDHVLVRGVGVTDVGTLAVPGSDHDAVWAGVSLETGRSSDQVSGR